jgi:adenine-specific DNA-methyltransferase
MPVKYIPFFPDTVEGQAILNNFVRTRRALKYRDDQNVYTKIKRGMPYYEVEKTESIGNNPKNMLIRGECISACAYLKVKGIKLDLVYIDPPFASGADYAKKVFIRKNPKVASVIKKAEEEMEIDDLKAFEEKMYGDIWSKEAYLNWMYENLVALKSIMSDIASIYVHLDHHIGHYVKILLDEVFGEYNFQREIIWDFTVLSGFKVQAKNWIRGHDSIFYYSCSDDKIFNKLIQPHTEEYKAMFKPDSNGRLAMTAHGVTRYWDEVEPKGKPFGDVWDDIMSFQQQPTSAEKVDYATQKPETLLERIIKASSNEKMIIADFFGGSGVTAKVANDLKRNFIHVDVGVNSMQTTRDRLREANAEFDILEIKDGVNLFRNPQQTMDKLKTMILGLKNEDALDKFWEGSIQDSKLGIIPVYLPNLLDHTTKVLDIPLMNRVINEAIPDLPDGVKKVIVYYIDIDDKKELEKFIKEQNILVEIELHDLKEILDDVIVNDIAEFIVKETKDVYEIEFIKFISDRLKQKIDEYNQKGMMQPLTEPEENGNDNIEEEENGAGKKKKKFSPIDISEQGLELIEMISLDCTNAKGKVWKSDYEVKIDKLGYVIENGKKSKTFWDAKISVNKKPFRMKVRNIAGDEIILSLEEEKKLNQSPAKKKGKMSRI